METTVSFPVLEGMRRKGALGEGVGTSDTMRRYALRGQRGEPGIAGSGMLTGTTEDWRVFVHFRDTDRPAGEKWTSPRVVWRDG